jgi:hypothetical protein
MRSLAETIVETEDYRGDWGDSPPHDLVCTQVFYLQRLQRLEEKLEYVLRRLDGVSDDLVKPFAQHLAKTLRKGLDVEPPEDVE